MRKILWILLVGFLVPGMLAAAQWVQKAELTTSPPVAFSDLGWSVSASADGTTIAVGAPLDGSQYEGAVYVYVRTSPTWTSMTQVAKLTASDSTGGDELGVSVSVSADGATVAAGAIGADISSHYVQGAVYMFVRPSTGWTNATQTAKLIASDGDQGDQLGSSVSMSADGSTIVAAAILARIGSNVSQGAAYVFTKPPSGWKNVTQSAKLTASDGREYDFLGISVSISSDGSTVASGLLGASGPFAPLQGAVYVFVRPAKGWADETQAAVLSASDGAYGDELGYSVALSADGSTVAAGAIAAEIPPYIYYGAVYVFERPKTGWADKNEAAKLTASDGVDIYALGVSLAMSAGGSVIVAEVPIDDAPSRYLDHGAAYVFVEPPGGWTSANQPQYETSKLAGTEDQHYGEYFSFLANNFSLSADGLTFVAGFPDNDFMEGGAAVFSDAVQFAQFQARGLEFSHSAFALNAGFVLSGESNGIDPVNEPVTLVIGSQVLAFPAGSFKRNGAGNYVFSGVAEGVAVDAQIKVLGSQTYQFLIEGHKANLAMPTNPLNVTLSIGDDTGTTLVAR